MKSSESNLPLPVLTGKAFYSEKKRESTESGGSIMEEKIPLHSKIWLAAADGGVGILSGLVTGGGMTYYFTKWMGMKPSLASLAWLIFGIWNAVNDPLFGFISDHTKSKLGRRIPYIRYGAPIYAASFILCWVAFPWAGASQGAMFAQMLVSLFLFDALYTAIATSLYVMPYEMTVDNDERGSIFTIKIFFSILSMAFPLVVLPLIQPQPGESAVSFRLFMTLLGIIIGVIAFASTFFYQEKHFFKEEKQPPFLKAIADCFKNPAFLVFEVISFTVIYIQTALMQGVLYYFDEFHISMIPCYGSLIVGAIVGLVIWIRYHERWGLSICIAIMCIIFAVGCLLMSFFGGHLAVAVPGFFAAGMGFAGGMYLVPMMMGDATDYDETKTGLRREGMYAGVNSFITKPAISIAQAAFLSIITHFGYVQNAAAGTQSATARQGLLIGWMLIPSILLFVCFFCMFLYPLKGEKWKAQKKHLAEEHSKKEAAYQAK